ncbi:MAG: cyclic nucleotide-binding domain-containing protein, partial [Desulfobulbaceae bacterium]|nr:cyclic nucleotide-binding domain-containing protein [Desulfobulbaceae bacterium]
KQLHLTPTKIVVPSPQEILSRANWLAEVTPETRDRLQASTDICIYADGDTLYQMGETEGSLALIARGVVEQIGTTGGTDNESTEDVLGPGSVLGIYNILTGKNDKTIRAQGPLEIIWFHRSTVVALVHQDPLFLKSLTRLYDEKQCNYRVP